MDQVTKNSASVGHISIIFFGTGPFLCGAVHHHLLVTVDQGNLQVQLLNKHLTSSAGQMVSRDLPQDF